ncbi:hypothetical protein LMG9449_0898 [Lactococcus lactis subsp. lactis]|uniref:Uncharacterized protein n=1 Tax=Lactococcus lactis subsp. lactis TaxID=1360 RepID=A0A0V8E054_LACLL|nr:hypothetical protein LMG9449_0898 [Lactococcus lactis subsp. lactis]
MMTYEKLSVNFTDRKTLMTIFDVCQFFLQTFLFHHKF